MYSFNKCVWGAGTMNLSTTIYTVKHIFIDDISRLGTLHMRYFRIPPSQLVDFT